jgi:hypothetical protein
VGTWWTYFGATAFFAVMAAVCCGAGVMLFAVDLFARRAEHAVRLRIGVMGPRLRGDDGF